MKNMPCLAGKFDLDQSEPKSSQVNASARNLRLLASPFGQGFRLGSIGELDAEFWMKSLR